MSTKRIYQAVFRGDVFTLVSEGYQLARPRIGRTREEPEVTSLLVDSIEDFLAGAGNRFDRYSVQAERPVRSSTRLGKKRRRIDIVIAATSGHRPSFSFEAKRLKRPEHMIGEYIGPAGMELFVNGSYAVADNEAGMLGYVQGEPVEVWYERLNRAIQASNTTALRVTEQLTRCTVHPMLSTTGRTSHSRRTGPLIVIYHVFLDCS